MGVEDEVSIATDVGKNCQGEDLDKEDPIKMTKVDAQRGLKRRKPKKVRKATITFDDTSDEEGEDVEDTEFSAKVRYSSEQEDETKDGKESPKFSPSSVMLLQQMLVLLLVVCGICMNTTKMIKNVKVHKKPNMKKRKNFKTAVKLSSSNCSNPLHSQKTSQLMLPWMMYPGAKLGDVKEMMGLEKLTMEKVVKYAQDKVRNRKEDKSPDIASLMVELARFALEENISSLTSSGGLGGR